MEKIETPDFRDKVQDRMDELGKKQVVIAELMEINTGNFSSQLNNAMIFKINKIKKMAEALEYKRPMDLIKNTELEYETKYDSFLNDKERLEYAEDDLESLEDELNDKNEEIKKLKEQLENKIFLEQEIKPTYQYSKIKDSELETLVDIKYKIDKTVFTQWFENSEVVDDETVQMFEALIEDNEPLIDRYSEEDLKVNFIVPIINRVHFKDYTNEFRDFYEVSMRYETDDFILKGTTDFMVSKGLLKSEKPYFFIQEFKRGEEYGNPRPQLLAELVSAIELNNEIEIKGAYIVGAIWYFVILEKISLGKYQYFISKSFDSMRIEDLKNIYKNLLFIKSEILKNFDRE